MATTLIRPETMAAPAPLSVPETATARLLSLDAFRGFIMLLLVSNGFGLGVLEHHAGWGWLARQVDHAAWEGCTFWDLIQPAFTFMVGVAMPFAFARRMAQGGNALSIFRHVAWRAFMLILLSNLYSNWGGKHPYPVLQLINVLSQIAFGYVICFLIMQLKFRWQVAAGAGMVAGYWLLFSLFPGPGGAWSQTGNIGAVIDLKVLGYNYSGYYTTINFIGNAVTILFGCWTGMLLRSPRSHTEKLKILGACAATGFAVGLALTPLIPMVKRLWTPSFLFFSAGWVIVMLMAFYWIIEVRKWNRWAFPFLIFGMNSIFAYSIGQIGLKGWLNRGLASFTGNFSFLGDLGAIPQQALVMACIWYACYWLYRRKIFFKI